MKIKEYNNIIDLELSLFKDLNMDGNEEIINTTSLKDLLCDTYAYNSTIYLVIKILDNKIICAYESYGRRKYATFDNILNVKVDDILLAFSERHSDENVIAKIDKNIHKEEYLINMKNWCDNNKIGTEFANTLLSNLKKREVITSSLIETTIRKLVKSEKEERKRVAEEKRKEKISGEKEIENKREMFEKESIYETDGYEFKIIKNEITFNYVGREKKYVFEKSVNKIFSYKEALKLDDRYMGDIGMFSKIKEKEENYRIEEKIDGEWVKYYEVGFKDKIEINGVTVTTSRINTVINNIRRDMTKEELKLLCQLPLMKIDALQMENITCPNNIELDINFSLDDKDTFKIKFMNKTKKVDWSFIKEHFFYGRSLKNSFGGSSIISFIKELGIKKQDFYSHLKKAVLINELEDKK